MPNATSIVVAGATGRVGAAVAGTLIERGEPVTLVTRQPGRASGWIAKGATLAIGDLADAQFLTGLLRHAESFFVVLPEDLRAPDFHAPRLRMADAIATAVRESGLRRVVMLSAIGAYLDRDCGPIADLHVLEHALRGSGATFTAVRSTYFQDNVAAMIPLAREAGIFPNFLPSADASFPAVATADAGRVAAEVLVARDAPAETVDVLGPFLSVRQQAEALGAAIGRPVQVVDVPPEGRVAALEQSGMSRAAAEAVAEMFGAFGRGEVMPKGDRQAMGTTTLDETLRRAMGADVGAG